MPYPTNQYNSGRTMLSSVASGLWTVMTLGLAQSSNTSSSSSNSSSTTTTSSTTTNTLTANTSNNEPNINEMLDCTNRFLALQSCHILLILSNHCTNELFRNPYRLALFHFTDTQGKMNLFLLENCFKITFKI